MQKGARGMKKYMRTKLIMLLVTVFCLLPFTVLVYASDNHEPLTVDAVWVDGDLLRIEVIDANGVTSTVAMCIDDIKMEAGNREYILIQAVDMTGNTSSVLEIRNPFFEPDMADIIQVPIEQNPAESPPPAFCEDGQQYPKPNETDNGPEVTESVIPAQHQLTPDGTGTVIDNVTDSYGIEFFTIGTEDGNVFFLVIDRQRSSDNVYLLNAVTEEDLISLAQQGGRDVQPNTNNIAVSAIPTPVPADTVGTPGFSNESNGAGESATTGNENEPTPPPQPEPSDEPETNLPAATSSNAGMYIFILAAMLGVGGAGYYFKIVKGKKDIYNDEDEDDEYGFDKDPEDDFENPEDGDDD